MSKRKKLPLLENILITDLASEGKSLAKIRLHPDHTHDTVIFVSGAVPGDVVDVQLTNQRKKFREGRVARFISYSSDRTPAFCKHFDDCGGCKWQHLPYEKQLFYKEKEVLDALQRIGKVELPAHNPIVGSARTVEYRNKMEFTFSNYKWLTKEMVESEEVPDDRNALGLHVPRFFDKVIDLDECYLQEKPSNAIRLAVRKFAKENEYTFFDIRKQEGLLRNLIIRTTQTGDLMVLVSFYYQDEPKQEALLQFLHTQFPEISSLLYVINPKGNDTISDLDIQTFAGKDHIIEQLGDLKFKIGPKSFFQTNTLQALELYKIAAGQAALSGDEVVYDLYTGTGTIANFVAKHARKVVGVEIVPEAIEDAWENARLNGIENVFFQAGDANVVLSDEFMNEHGKPDVVIIDPPRAGLHGDVVQSLLNLSAPRIVYVSCNAATQARDIQLLSEKYTVTFVQPVDMFPHTHHVENVATLELIEA